MAEATFFARHVLDVLLVIEQSAEDFAEHFLVIAPSNVAIGSGLAQVFAVGQHTKRTVGHKFRVRMKVLRGRQLLFAACFNAIDGERLHAPNHQKEQQVKLLHFVNGMIQCFFRLDHVALFILVEGVQYVQDLDPEVASIQHAITEAQI